MALNSGIQTYQILTNDDEVCIPSLSSILLAVCTYYTWKHKEREILEYFNTFGMILQAHRAFQKSTHFLFGKLRKATEEFRVKSKFNGLQFNDNLSICK